MLSLVKVFFSSVIPKIFIFILNIALARNLNLGDFGTYAYVKSFFNFFETIISSSLVPHSVSSLSNETLRVGQVTSIYFLFAVITALLSALTIIVDGTISSIYIPIILGIGVFGSIANSYMYVRVITKDKTDILFLSSFLSLLILGVLLYFSSINSVEYALLFIVTFNCLDFLFRWTFLKRHTFNIKFEVSNLQLKKPLLLMASLGINGVIFLFQRIMLAKTENGMEQMAYLEIVMIIFSLIAVFLSSQGNYLMGQKKLIFLKYELVAFKLLLFLTLASSTIYSIVILFARPAIYWIFNIEITQTLCIAASFMIFIYSIAFYSVRLAIMKNMQDVTLTSTVVSAGFAFVPFLYLDVSALSIVYSYCLFYLALSLSNFLFVFWRENEIKKSFN